MEMKVENSSGDQPVDGDDASEAFQSYGIGSRIAVGAMAIILLTFGVAGWAANAELAGAVVSPGTVVVDQNAKKVQHPEGGIVADISVRNGDRVQHGEVLMRLDATQVRTELAVIRSQLSELRSRHVRLSAERDLAHDVEFPEAFQEDADAQPIIAGEARLFAANLATRLAQKSQLQKRIEQLRYELAGYTVQQQAKERELQLVRSELEKTKLLHAKGYATETRLLAIEREEVGLSGERGSLMSQAAKVEGKIQEIELQILAIDQTARREAQRELRDIEARVAELVEREAAASDRLERMQIKAPRAGVVHELAVHTIGGVVTAAEPIMLIVPTDVPLSVEIKIDPRQIDRVRLNQPVRLVFSSFSQETSPELAGRLNHISADVSRDPRSGGEFYTARVIVDGAEVPVISGRGVVPGMPVEAYISTGSRTALSYFTKPITDHVNRAFKEE